MGKKRVCIIGPFRPYRGGIAHSNNNLYFNLSKDHELLNISFKRMYPRFLYPGKGQHEPKENREMKDTLYLIDSINPFSWFKAFKEIEEWKPDVLLFCWWHIFFFPAYYLIALLAKRKLKCKIGCICHHVVGHEKIPLGRIIFKLFMSKVDYTIVYARSVADGVKKIIPNAKVDFVLENQYSGDFDFSGITKEKAKEKLGIKKDCILFFGIVRKYKGLEYLIKAMPEVIKKKDVLLIIAGEFWEDKNSYLKLIKEHGLEENVLIIDKYIAKEDVPLYFKAADVAVLPYTSGALSAVVNLSVGFEKPVITTSVGGNLDYVTNRENGLIVPPKDSEKLAEAILEFYSEGLETKFVTKIKETNKLLNWNKEKEKIFLGENLK